MSALLGFTQPPPALSYPAWVVLLTFCLLGLTISPAGSQTPAAPFTLISAEQQEPLPTVVLDGHRMVALNDLAIPFGLALGDDR